MSDDHATHAISAYGSRINRTPNLDRIAAEALGLKTASAPIRFARQAGRLCVRPIQPSKWSLHSQRSTRSGSESCRQGATACGISDSDDREAQMVQPFHIGVSLPSRQEESQGIALFGRRSLATRGSAGQSGAGLPACSPVLFPSHSKKMNARNGWKSADFFHGEN